MDRKSVPGQWELSQELKGEKSNSKPQCHIKEDKLIGSHGCLNADLEDKAHFKWKGEKPDRVTEKGDSFLVPIL